MIEALIRKDLSHCWKLLAGFSLAVLLLSVVCVLRFPPGHEKLPVLRTAVLALVISAGMGFAWAMVVAERRRRHLILLRSLPVGQRIVAWGKFLTALGMSLLVLAAAELPWQAAGLGASPRLLAGSILAMAFYIALILLLGITFRQPAAAMIPFYVVLMGAFIFQDFLEVVLDLVSSFAALAAPVTAAATAGSVELAALVLGRRELDL